MASERPVGRPTIYKPEYCEVIINRGRDGGSVNSMAVACGVHKQTLLEWAAAHEEFGDALKLAKALSLEWWENVAGRHMIEEQGAPKLNSAIWSRSMAARFPDDYRDNSKIELTGKDGGAIKTDNRVEVVLVKPE